MKASSLNLAIITSHILLILNSTTIKCQAPGYLGDQHSDTSGNKGLSLNNLGSDAGHNAGLKTVRDNSQPPHVFRMRRLLSKLQGSPLRRLLKGPTTPENQDN